MQAFKERKWSPQVAVIAYQKSWCSDQPWKSSRISQNMLNTWNRVELIRLVLRRFVKFLKAPD